MDNFKMVEELVNKTHVSYSDAKSALERTNWNMLDAIVLLENEGKTSCKQKIRKGAENCANEVKKAVDKGNKYNFEMYHDGKRVFSLPAVAAAVIGIIGFELAIPATIIALICGCTFKLENKTQSITTSNNNPVYINGDLMPSGYTSSSSINLSK
ncbi:MAG: DUF4342 domain-containing protein [Oscillospiraceae bacterium]|nr:DUF4342 domain-containing protein [Oscillospiraceae bacterium]